MRDLNSKLELVVSPFRLDRLPRNAVADDDANPAAALTVDRRAAGFPLADLLARDFGIFIALLWVRVDHTDGPPSYDTHAITYDAGRGVLHLAAGDYDDAQLCGCFLLQQEDRRSTPPFEKVLADLDIVFGIENDTCVYAAYKLMVHVKRLDKTRFYGECSRPPKPVAKAPKLA